LFLFILESLGSTELVFILIMALVFFGPRKLPQISRSLGKNLAEFRRASEEFKRTWDREVSLEENNNATRQILPEQNAMAESNGAALPTVGTVAPEEVVARHTLVADNYSAESDESPTGAVEEPPHSPKNDWL
jgi:TatA/E family protein of Tat protein translocase